jgi:hypothetical protein
LGDLDAVNTAIFNDINATLKKYLPSYGLTAAQTQKVVGVVNEELAKPRGPDLFKLDTLYDELKLDKYSR